MHRKEGSVIESFLSSIQSLPPEEWKKRFKHDQEEIRRETAFNEVGDILSRTIKRDYSSKLITFSGMLLAQTEEDQTNIGFESVSVSGKSYIPVELSNYFPTKDLLIVASASPTSFFHEVGIWDEEKQATIVNLENKILVFLDQPHYLLLERLRPLLSHDRKELVYKITDVTKKGGRKTKTVILIGFPSVVFCTVKVSADEQEKTRMFQLSPSIDEEKLEEALKLLAYRRGQRKEFIDWFKNDPKRIWLLRRIEQIRNKDIKDVYIPDVENTIYKKFRQTHKRLKPRDMRDLPRIISLIKAHALLNCFTRQEKEPGRIIATEKDIEAGFNLYGEVSLPNELNLSPYTFGVYRDVILPLLEDDTDDIGVPRRIIAREYYRVYNKPISENALKDLIPDIENAGLIYQEPDPTNRSRLLIHRGQVNIDREQLDSKKKAVGKMTGLPEKPSKTTQSSPQILPTASEPSKPAPIPVPTPVPDRWQDNSNIALKQPKQSMVCSLCKQPIQPGQGYTFFKGKPTHNRCCQEAS